MGSFEQRLGGTQPVFWCRGPHPNMCSDLWLIHSIHQPTHTTCCATWLFAFFVLSWEHMEQFVSKIEDCWQAAARQIGVSITAKHMWHSPVSFLRIINICHPKWLSKDKWDDKNVSSRGFLFKLTSETLLVSGWLLPHEIASLGSPGELVSRLPCRCCLVISWWAGLCLVCAAVGVEMEWKKQDLMVISVGFVIMRPVFLCIVRSLHTPITCYNENSDWI